MAKKRLISTDHPLWAILERQKERMLEAVYQRAVDGFNTEAEGLVQARPDKVREMTENLKKVDDLWAQIQALIAQAPEPIRWTRIKVDPVQYSIYRKDKRGRLYADEGHTRRGLQMRFDYSYYPVEYIKATRSTPPTEMASLVLSNAELNELHQKWMQDFITTEHERIENLFDAITMQISLADDASDIVKVLEQAGVPMPDLTQVGNLGVELDETLNAITKVAK